MSRCEKLMVNETHALGLKTVEPGLGGTVLLNYETELFSVKIRSNTRETNLRSIDLEGLGVLPLLLLRNLNVAHVRQLGILRVRLVRSNAIMDPANQDTYRLGSSGRIGLCGCAHCSLCKTRPSGAVDEESGDGSTPRDMQTNQSQRREKPLFVMCFAQIPD
jgi:hypothetical protein